MRLDLSDGTCDLCGHRKPALIWRRRGHSLVRCPMCGLVFTVLEDSPRRLREAYEAGEFVAPSDDSPRRLAVWRGRLQAVLALGAVGRLLDVGCGKGGFLREARRSGLLAFGAELSEREARTALSLSGAPVAVADALSLPFEDGAFGAVTMWNVLEHVASPKGALREAHRVLAPGGLLALTVPNMAPPLGPLGPFLRRKSGRWRLFRFEEAGHLYHFSRRTLSLYLALTGFSVIKLWAGEAPPVGRGLPLPRRAPMTLKRALGMGSPLFAIARKEG